MTTRVKKHLDLLRVLHTASPKLRRAILETADNDIVRCLADCSHNTLNGNLKLTDKQKKGLKRYRTPLRLLARKKVPLKAKRQILLQKQNGGLLGGLLAPIIGIAVSLLADQVLK